MNLFPESNFQAGGIFVLLIAFPFLIVMITVHSKYQDVIIEASRSCGAICDAEISDELFRLIDVNKKMIYFNEDFNVTHPQKSTAEDNDDDNDDDDTTTTTPKGVTPPENVTTPTTPKAELKKSRKKWSRLKRSPKQDHEFRTEKKFKNFFMPLTQMPSLNPSIGALLEFSVQSVIFKCPLAIFSVQLALTTSNCIKNPNEIYKYKVRLGSDFWSQYGELNVVRNIIENKMFPGNEDDNHKWLAVVFDRPKSGRHYIFTLVIPLYYSNTLYSRKAYFWNHTMYSRLEHLDVTLPENYKTLAEFYQFNKTYSCAMNHVVALENAPIISGRYLLGIYGKNNATTLTCYYWETFYIEKWMAQLAIRFL